MADELNHISHILERVEEEFQVAMREEVGDTPPCTTNLNKIEFLVYLLIAQYKEREKSKFWTSCSGVCLISL